MHELYALADDERPYALCELASGSLVRLGQCRSLKREGRVSVNVTNLSQSTGKDAVAGPPKPASETKEANIYEVERKASFTLKRSFCLQSSELDCSAVNLNYESEPGLPHQSS